MYHAYAMHMPCMYHAYTMQVLPAGDLFSFSSPEGTKSLWDDYLARVAQAQRGKLNPTPTPTPTPNPNPDPNVAQAQRGKLGRMAAAAEEERLTSAAALAELQSEAQRLGGELKSKVEEAGI